jgi:hypothetical protein
MSAVENLASHEDDMMQEVQKVQELMAKSESGQKMMEASVAMAGTQEMNDLMVLIGNPEVSEEERMLLAQYMGEMLKRDAKKGMLMYSEYLKSVAANPDYAERKDYYLSVSDAAIAVDATESYQEYIVAYQKFEEDASEEAKSAREATETMQSKMREWAEM